MSAAPTIPRATLCAPWWERLAAWLNARPIVTRNALDPLLDSRDTLELAVEKARAMLQHAEWALALHNRINEDMRRELLELRRDIALARRR